MDLFLKDGLILNYVRLTLDVAIADRGSEVGGNAGCRVHPNPDACFGYPD